MSVTMRVIARSQRKRVVVFSHGLGYEHASMLPLMRKVSDLSHNGATLLAAELPSHGSNTSDVTLIEQPHTHPYADWGELTDALIASTRAVCAEQGVESVDGVGHSMSGALLLMASLRAPELFRSLVVLEPITLPPPYTTDLRKLAQSPAHTALKRRDGFESIAEAMNWYRARDAYANWTDECLRLHCETALHRGKSGLLEMRASPTVQAALYLGGSNTQIFDSVIDNDIRFPPVTLLSGQHTFYTQRFGGNPSLFEVISTSLKGKTIPCLIDAAIVPNSSHSLPFEQIDTVADFIITHLRETAQPEPKL
eukprot:TRINITY_DN1899_c0_g1_i1.p1 TRINITY_DN1899_c0_g1~~TRINITY_DN1899_c0_g1_i1.p1  ORF type:complete len:323 (+),score=34.87 TRINITY_DN1899_c0_g1_i1:41-970(+)